ncbi:MAG: hypothetical protein CSA62_01640 [Planctomycetota bacterium]|nr:MAG: hypothetical protein CSA62_01640 [Planctomycetota bacterium]
MTERPLLILPKPDLAERTKMGGGGGGPKPLGQIRQKQRIAPRLLELESAFEAKRLALQTSTSGLVPEDVLVLETAGSVEDFFNAVGKVEGLEFLGEYDEEDIPPDDDFFVEKKGVHKSYRGRVYLMFSNQEAFRQLLKLWKTWQGDEKLARGFTKWREVFSLLRDIRPWSVRDRLEETGVLEDWTSRLEWQKDPIPCEIELWFRGDEAQRRAASQEVRCRVEALGGKVLSEAVVAEIHYHALAVRLPAKAVQDLLDESSRGSVALVQAEQIQFIRAAGQMAGRVGADEANPLSQLPAAPYPQDGVDPVVALLDGLPLQAHQALAGRLTVDDPDDFGSDYEARFRLHGTAMASLIIWGDLHAPGQPIPQPLYVRPIMQPFVQQEFECLPPEERVSESHLIVDLIHRAVRRMFEGEGSEPPSAPNVAVINLSIGIADRPFGGTMSPLARLLDWLSWKYSVLFLVSAGNCYSPVKLGRPWGELSSVPHDDLVEHIVRGGAADTRHRRLLSPAEGMNIVTVAALHSDEDPSSVQGYWIDAAEAGFPSPINAQGLGYKRSVKPEVLAAGGRVVFRLPFQNGQTELEIPRLTYRPGQLVATPGPAQGDVTATVPSRRTSNATALMSRAAAFAVPVLDDLRLMDGGEVLNNVPDALWLKALLVHSARWGELGEAYQALLGSGDNSGKLKESLTRLLGYGAVDLDSILECTEHRVTALAGASLDADAGAEHRFPLPPSLSGKRGWRSLAVTLVWMTPIHPLNHRWRRAHLWYNAPTSKMNVGTDAHLKRNGADWQATRRGTVQHEVFEGEKAAVFIDGDDIVVHVSCREDAKDLTGSVPYALVVTLEVDEGIDIDIYAEIRERVQSKLRVSTGEAL